LQAQLRAEPPKKKVRSEEIERQKRDARVHVGLTETMLSVNPLRTMQVPPSCAPAVAPHPSAYVVSLLRLHKRPQAHA
jgi:hypothetical protein